MNGFLNIYKESSITPLQKVKQLQKMLHTDTKIAYAGRLDPLASGVLLLLIGDTCKERSFFQNLSKSYFFDLILGIETDTSDPMGIIQNMKIEKNTYINEELLVYSVKKFIGKIEMKYPFYSSKTIDGVPMYKLSRDGLLKENLRPKKFVNVYQIEVKEIEYVEYGHLSRSFIESIAKVKGDFRQKEIIKQWENTGIDQKVTSVRIFIRASSGTYVRSLAEMIGKELGTYALAYNITRVQVDKFSLENSLKV